MKRGLITPGCLFNLHAMKMTLIVVAMFVSILSVRAQGFVSGYWQNTSLGVVPGDVNFIPPTDFVFSTPSTSTQGNDRSFVPAVPGGTFVNFQSQVFSSTIQAVPEPSTFAFIGLALRLIGIAQSRFKKPKLPYGAT